MAHRFQLNRPKQPPKRFIPSELADNDLIAYGLPQQPDRAKCPQQYTQWERLMSRPLTFIPPDLEPIEYTVSAEIQEVGTKRGNSKIWSGIVNNMVKSRDKFVHIEATWTVPLVYPPPDKWNQEQKKWDTAGDEYSCGIWTGIDGYHTSFDVLQAGTGLRCTVQDDGTLKQRSFAWFEWYPEDWVAIKNFDVKGGDVITVLVDYCGPDAGGVKGKAVYINETNSTYTTIEHIYKSKSSKNDFKGDTAEWICEGHTGKSKTPNFAATFMYNCLAVTEQKEERNLEWSRLVDMIRDNTRLSTAVKLTDNVLGMYFGSGQAFAHHVEDQ